ncbi:MAG: hypothetical protein Q4F96_04945, partial [Bacillota bacterium]|nr:hypothetical protein [Bacillota bacterium]
ASPFQGIRLDSYEIHMGVSEVRGEPFCALDNGKSDGCHAGNVYGTYLHGLFDTGALAEALIRELTPRVAIAMHFRTPEYEIRVSTEEAFCADMHAARL